MRGSMWVWLMLATVAASLDLTSPSSTSEQQNIEPSSAWNSVEHRPWRRTKRQLSEIVRLYQNLVKENREDQMQARNRIQELLGRVFASPDDAMSKQLPAGNETSTENNSTMTSGTTARPLVKIDRTMLLANLRRNLRGIGRLFMRELRAALSQSKSNLGTYWTELKTSLHQPISRNKSRRHISPPYQQQVSTQDQPATKYQPPVSSQYQQSHASTHNQQSTPYPQLHMSTQYQQQSTLHQQPLLSTKYQQQPIQYQQPYASTFHQQISTQNQQPLVSTQYQQPLVSTEYQQVHVSTQYQQQSPKYQQPQVSTQYQQQSTRYQQPHAFIQQSTQYKQPLVSTQYQRPLVSTQYQQAQVSTKYQQPLVSTHYQQPLVSTEYQQPYMRPARVTSDDPKSPVLQQQDVTLDRQ